MPIPDYQSFLLPFLKQLSDGAEHTSREVTEQLAAEYLPGVGVRISDSIMGLAVYRRVIDYEL